MATVINNPSAAPTTVERTIDRTGDTSAGWAVAVIVLIAVIAVGSFVWLRFYRAAPATVPANGGANINVTLPSAPGADTGTAPSNNGETGGNIPSTPTQ